MNELTRENTRDGVKGTKQNLKLTIKKRKWAKQAVKTRI
jgi:hypothetical protein